MKRLALAILLVAGTALAQEVKSTPLQAKDLVDMQGKEATMSVVEYAPGYVGVAHRHNAQVFVYVLEGSVVMQVRGGNEVTLGPGATFYESPEDVHVVGRNASKTQAAKFLVFLVKDKGAPVSVPVK